MLYFKEWLDEQRAASLRQAAYREGLINLWLADELSEKEFFQLTQEQPEAELLGFTVLYVDCKAFSPALEAFLRPPSSPLLKKAEQKQVYLVILLGQSHQAKRFTNTLQERFYNTINQIILGETVVDWENVYESYNQVRRSLFTTARCLR